MLDWNEVAEKHGKFFFPPFFLLYLVEGELCYVNMIIAKTELFIAEKVYNSDLVSMVSLVCGLKPGSNFFSLSCCFTYIHG